MTNLALTGGSRTLGGLRPLRFGALAPRAFVVAVAVLASMWAPSAALGQLSGPPPKELEGVGITEHADAQLPLDAVFNDENGQPVRLGDFIGGDRPTILTLVYFNCPMLCTLVLNGLVDGMKDLQWSAGKEFQVVTVSFDPKENATLARQKKQNYLKMYGRAGADEGWHFLTGTEENIHRLTEAVGFNYRWDEEKQQYAHQAAIFIATPQGHVSRYLYGVIFPPKDLKLALLEASKGKIGSTLDRIVLYCYCYDPAAGSYALKATNFTRGFGAVLLAVFGGWLASVWIRSARKKKAPPAGKPD
jgi:protein SCO1/2